MPWTPIPSSRRPGARVFAPLLRLRARHSALGFGARLVLALVITLAVLGGIGYSLMARQLRQQQTASYASIVRADIQGFEAIGRTSRSSALALTQVDRLLDAVGDRPGVLEAILVDQSHTVRASGTVNRGIGVKDSDPRIDAALLHGATYSGREADPRRNPKDFEFVVPVQLPDGRYAFEVGYHHRFLDAELASLRGTLALVGLLALAVGALVFYLVGGRSLVRSHRYALVRAMRDGLTDMPNQRAFQEDLTLAIASAKYHDAHLGLAVLDIDDFKLLNRRYGNAHGDALLKRVATILAAGRIEDRAYRLGGDEFAVLLPRVDAAGVERFARRLSRQLTESEAMVSIGICDLRVGESGELLRAEADAAVLEAKRRGGHCVVSFDDIRDRVAITTPESTDAVRRLIDEAGLRTVLQPIWDLDSHTLLGVEALMRPDPKYGFSSPAEVFDLAEQIGHMHELDVLCVQSALTHVSPELPDGALLFLNLSPQTLDIDGDGGDWFCELIERSALTPERVVVEVTERFAGRTASILKSLSRLRDQGFRLALDDVGTGNSGLEMLRNVGADFVKIDRSIVSAAPIERNARAVLMAMATYARQTGSFVIAEGIEDQETLDFLGEIDDGDLRPDRIIQGGQGYGLGRPGSHLASEPPGLLPHAVLHPPAREHQRLIDAPIAGKHHDHDVPAAHQATI
jgi:diguanylate cyclase (GGDEF)-like protein